MADPILLQQARELMNERGQTFPSIDAVDLILQYLEQREAGGRTDREIVRDLGMKIGWGNIMSLSEQCWREHLIATRSVPGGEHTTGPCAAFMVPCPCVDKRDDQSSCDWCCGARRVTKRVLEAMELHLAAKPSTADDLDELQQLCDAATPGPWVLDACELYVLGEELVFTLETGDDGEATRTSRADARFVIAARDALPKLIAEVRRLRGVLGSPCCEKCATNVNDFKCGICGVEVG